jgi:hypothetical protein
VFSNRSFAAAVAVLSTGLAAGPSASAGVPHRISGDAGLETIERGGERLGRAIDQHRREELGARHRELRAQAAELGIDARGGLASKLSLGELERAVSRLRERIDAAREEQGAFAAGAATGVSQATLESIAACESGGDPGAVNPAGYYGKYQFDPGTWASVGGAGNPAEAPEAEQDMRAAMLYQRTGGSAWPVCGA